MSKTEETKPTHKYQQQRLAKAKHMHTMAEEVETREEQGAKQSNDKKEKMKVVVKVEGAIIVGAGPSGLACAACLEREKVPFVILDRDHCIASLWHNHTYDRLRLHLPKKYCELPHAPFPESFPQLLARAQFLSYLHYYAHAHANVSLRLRLGHRVDAAHWNPASAAWHVLSTILPPPSSKATSGEGDSVGFCEGSTSGMWREYVGRWLVVASGENAEKVMPNIPGMENFRGMLLHSSQYKSGRPFQGLKVLVVGCGNSGMEIALDLCHHYAKPSISVRGPVHVLPREMLGMSTFGVAMGLMKVVPVRVVDWVLLLLSRMAFGDTAVYGLRRPKDGPLLLKATTGRTPVLDVGTFHLIRTGQISVVPGIKRVTATGVVFEDDRTADFDVIVCATGYRSNVNAWLKDDGGHFSKEGLPRQEWVGKGQHWKADGNRGLYVAGLSGRGLLGSATDAHLIAHHISTKYHALHNPNSC